VLIRSWFSSSLAAALAALPELQRQQLQLWMTRQVVEVKTLKP